MSPPKRPLHPIRVGLICFSITANALCAGAVYSFPLISPALVAHMKLTQPQLTTIALAGMVGQYPFAAFVGKILDKYGPRMCSLLASLLFSIGLGLFSLEIANTPDDISISSASSFRRLAVYFGMAGLATVLSYFSIVFSATKTFPHFNGVASGTSMALFGFSPLLLSAIASKFFTNSETGLNVTYFIGFLALLTGFIHLFSAICMQGAEKLTQSTTQDGTIGSDSNAVDFPEDSEQEPLLRSPTKSTSDADPSIVTVPEPQDGSVGDLLKDPYFWLLLTVCLVVIGAAETVMANLGSVYLSLPTSSSTSPDVSTQVQLLSASNTLSRLLVGPVADFVSPVAAYVHGGVWSFPRKQHVSRVAFLVGAALLVSATLFLLETGIRSRETMWPLSVGIGIAYGTTFTILPGILSSIWGIPNLGRNFGVFSYSPFVGTTLFSYLYAFVAESHTGPNETACEGTKCWQLTFGLSSGLALLAAGGAVLLWRAWRGRV